MSMYGFDGNLSAEDWLNMGLSPEALTDADKIRLVMAGVIEPKWIDHIEGDDLDLGLHLPEPDYTANLPKGVLAIGD